MLEVALINYIGAGLRSFAPVYNLSVPQGATTDAVELLRLLNKWNSDRTAKFTTTTVERIWAASGSFGHPNAVDLLHLQKLSEILISCGPDKDALVGALAVASTQTTDREAAIKAAAGRLSTQIIAKAAQHKLLQSSGVNEAAACVYLEMLYIQLLLSNSFLDDTQHVLELHLQTIAKSNGRTTIVHKSDAAKFTGDRAAPDEDRAKQHAAIAIVHGLTENNQIASRQLERIAAQTKCSANRAEAQTLCDELGVELDHIAKLQPAMAEAIAGARLQLMAGNLLQVEADLFKTNANLASLPGNKPEYAELKARIYCARGLLRQLQSQPREAAGCFAAAAEVSPRTDYDLYWRFIERQARALVQHGEENAEPAAIEEAIKVCANAIVELHLIPSQACYIHAKALLGRLFVLGSAHDLADDRNRAAIGYLRQAATHYQAQGPAAVFFDVRFNLVQALIGIGNSAQNTVYLEEAVRLCQRLLAEDARQFGRRDETATWLGLALAGLGNIRKSQEILKLSRDTLRCGLRALQAVPSSRQSLLAQGHANAALARQLIDTSSNGGLNREAYALLHLAQSNLRECGAAKAAEQLSQDIIKLDGTPASDLPSAVRSHTHLESPACNQSVMNDEAKTANKQPVLKDDNNYLFRLRASMRQSSAEKQERDRSRKRLFG